MNHSNSPSAVTTVRPSHIQKRLFSPPSDPVKSAILRDSGQGWNSHANNAAVAEVPVHSDTTSALQEARANSRSPVTTPLRISKRGSPQRGLARRQSSSYNHVRTNNLVTNSPFRKSMLPTPVGPRKVSGEKRPRPVSMNDQVENERPAGFKRRQSKAYIGLTEKEPVTKSPFRKPPPSLEDEHPPVPPVHPLPHFEKPKLKTLSIPTRVNNIASPSRSALVSKRFHGPRSAPPAGNGNGSGSDSSPNRRARRKTVSFNERCDVLEFEKADHEMQDDVFDTTEDEADDPPPVPAVAHVDDDHLDHLVDNIWRCSAPSPDIPTRDEDTSFHSNLSTSPRAGTLSPEDRTEDGILLGRSVHIERQRAAHYDEDSHDEPDDFFERRSTSPSPMKTRAGEPSLPGGPPPKFDRSPSARQPNGDNEDPFEFLGEPDHFLSEPDHSVNSICISDIDEVLNAATRVPDEYDDDDEEVGVLPRPPLTASTPPLSLTRRSQSPKSKSPITSPRGTVPSRSHSQSPFASPRTGSPLARSPINSLSPGVTRARQIAEAEEEKSNSNGSPNGRSPRISREEVQKRLMKQHSFESPLREDWPVPPTNTELRTRPPLPPLPGSNSGSPSPRVSRSHSSSPRVSNAFADSPNVSGPPSPCSAPSVSHDDHSPGSVSITSAEIREATIERVERFSMRSPRASPAPSRSGTPSKDRRSTPSPAPHLRETPAVHTPLDMEFNFDTEPMSMDTEFDFGQPGVEIADMRSALDRLMADVARPDPVSKVSVPSRERKLSAGLKVEELTTGIRAKQLQSPDISIADTDPDADPDADGDEEMTHDTPPFVPHPPSSAGRPRTTHPERAATDTALVPSAHAHAQHFSPLARTGSGSGVPPPPPVPAKDNIRAREELILEKRRKARALEGDDGPGGLASPRTRTRDFSGSSGGHDDAHIAHVRANSMKKSERPGRRRSMSTGDADDLESAERTGGPGAMRRAANVKKEMMGLLGVPFEGEEDPFAFTESVEKELMKLEKKTNPKAYQVKEREVIYASSDGEKVSHLGRVGDLETGKAWKTVRRPSDMNEYARQIRELRAQEKPGKAHGKVFVRVMGVKDLDLPLPKQPTILSCTLNNGIHFVTTPESRLEKNSTIDQEFELIEHSKLEFTLTLKVRRDPHIVDQFKTLAAASTTQAPPAPPPAPVQQHKSSGMRGFFGVGSTPKKQPTKSTPPPRPQPAFKVRPLEENLARYLRQDGTLARAFVSFKDVSKHCDMRLLETCYPLIGQKIEINGTVSTVQIGEIQLQMFRLPPLPGIPTEQQPQSLEECHRGLRHLHWHKVTYLEGTLTQMGGDCSTWRRRQFRLIGANLIAFNDVTKRAITTIDLKKATGVEDENETRSRLLSPALGLSTPDIDQYEGIYGVERSFRLRFPRGQEIMFFADTDDEKERWLDVFRAIVGRIPPNPLWAELVWQRQQDIAKQGLPASSSPS